MKKLKGEGNFSSYFDNNEVTYIKMPNFGFELGQEEWELWGKINYLYTAKENCFQADRLEINIWVNAIICEIIFYLDCCLDILLYLRI